MDVLLWEDLPADAKEAGGQGLKPEEEVARLTVDEHLSEVERLNLFLTGGHAVQERRAIDSLPALLKAKGRAGWEAVQANLLQLLSRMDVISQIALAESLSIAVQQRALLPGDVADCLLPLAAQHCKSKDKAEEEAEAWLQLLLEMLHVLGSPQLLELVLPLALAQGQVNEPVACRVSCCRILGGMVPQLAPAEVVSRFLPQLLAACQDTDYAVRIAAAEQLPPLARVLGGAAAVSQLLPELTELLADDEAQVRVAALSSLVAMCSLLPAEQRRSQLLPLTRRHMQPLELALPLQRALASLFPELLAAIANDLEPSDAGLLYGCFRHLAARSDCELRRTCALRLPALMARPLPGSSASYLHDTWTDLAADHDVQVRAAIASQFHQVARGAAAVDAVRLLRKPLVLLLRDASAAVRDALLPALPDTLQVLSGADEMHRDGLASDVHQALLVALAGVGNNWRAQQHLAAALPALPGLLASEVLAEQWTPYAFGLLLNGAAAVKPAAATGLACLLRGCRKERPRSELYCRIMRELAWGRSCWARLAYIQLCSSALPVFSCRWFKGYLLEGVLELLGDAVPNVRLAALGLLPALKQTIRLPEDVEQLEQLSNAMSSLMTDNDRDVSHAARSVHDAFKRTPLRMTGGAGLLEMSGSTTGAADFEAADRAKEEAEQDLTISQEELEKLRIEWCASSPERRGRRLGGMIDAGGAGSSSSTCSSGHASVQQGLMLRRNNSRGKGDGGLLASSANAGTTTSSGSGGSSAYSSQRGAAGATAAGGLAGSRAAAAATGSSSAGMSWSPDGSSRGLFDRRFAANTSSSSSSSPSSSSSAASGLALRTQTGAAAAGISSRGGMVRSVGAGNGSTQGPASSSSSSSYGSVGSPRYTAATGSSGSSGIASAASKAAGAGGGSGTGGAGTALLSPTGSNPLANLRLPVLAGSPKAAAGSQGAPAGFGSATASSSSASAVGSPSSSYLAGSRLGLGHSAGSAGIGPGSLGGFGSPVAAAAAAGGTGVGGSLMRPMPGSLAAAAAAAAGGRGSGDGSSKAGSNSSRGATSPTKAGGGSASAFSSAVGSKPGSSGLIVSGASRLIGMQGGGGGVASSNSSGANSSAAGRRFR